MLHDLCNVIVSAMHRVGSAGNTNNSTRPRKEKRLTYVLNDSDDTKVNSLFLYFICSRKMTKFHILFLGICIFIPTNIFFDICL